MPHPAPVLDAALHDIDQRWPARDRRSDGWIGDTTHQLTASDHNPDPAGIVHARDFDSDGLDAPLLVAALIAHPSTNYVIHNRTIWSRSRGFRARAYTGRNPHTGHIHWSILHTDAARNSAVRLRLGGHQAGSGGTGGLAAMPELRSGSRHSAVRTLQGALHRAGHPVPIDGVFGQRTRAAVVAFQAAHRLPADAVVGPRTWCALAQSCLVWHGFNPGPVDGVCGPGTINAIRSMQSSRGLVVDGVLGPVSWAQLT